MSSRNGSDGTIRVATGPRTTIARVMRSTVFTALLPRLLTSQATASPNPVITVDWNSSVIPAGTTVVAIWYIAVSNDYSAAKLFLLCQFLRNSLQLTWTDVLLFGKERDQ